MNKAQTKSPGSIGKCHDSQKTDRLWNVILDCWSVERCHDSQNQPFAVRSSKPASPSTSPSGPNKPEALQYVQANLPLHRPVQVVQTNLKWLTNTQFPSTHKKLRKFNHDRSLRNSYTPFYTQRTFLELTEIYEYLHGNVKMSTQSVRAP